MQWISRNKGFLSIDLDAFDFDSNQRCSIQTLILRRNSPGKPPTIENEIHESEQEYLRWVEKLQLLDHEPSVVLVLHGRITSGHAKATSLAYEEETFKIACRNLFQHRSSANAITRHSTAIITSRTVTAWKSKQQWGDANVYHCKSDNKSSYSTGSKDIVLSVTNFPKAAKTFAVFYGCTSDARKDIVNWFLFAKVFAFDPLLVPMMFVEYERKRLIDTLDVKRGELRQRILEMNNRLKEDGIRSSISSHSGDFDQDTSDFITQRECSAVNLWVDVSTLKNGLLCFSKQLELMTKMSESRQERTSSLGDAIEDQYEVQQHSASSIQARLHDIIIEIDSNIKHAESLLGGMSQAAQAETNFLSRQDTRATISIAVDTKIDSSHMLSIAFFGMIFLPGTFFATLFSMTFFNWIPQDSNQTISPWIAMYFGLTFLATGALVWRFQKWANYQKRNAVEKLLLAPDHMTAHQEKKTQWVEAQGLIHEWTHRQDRSFSGKFDIEAGLAASQSAQNSSNG